MAGGGSSKANPPTTRKRVDADSASSAPASSLVRAKDGSAFARCDECSRNVPVALINFHNCSLDARIKMTLEAQVVEKPAEVNKKPVEKRKAKSTDPNAKKGKKAKASDGPKRPPTAFFLFMDDFRKTFKEANPDSKLVKEVAKHGGEKWKSMSDEEKKVYRDKAAELKAEFQKLLNPNGGEEAENAENEEETAEDDSPENGEKVEAVSD